jgi:hypothetical protein
MNFPPLTETQKDALLVVAMNLAIKEERLPTLFGTLCTLSPTYVIGKFLPGVSAWSLTMLGRTMVEVIEAERTEPVTFAQLMKALE